MTKRYFVLIEPHLGKKSWEVFQEDELDEKVAKFEDEHFYEFCWDYDEIIEVFENKNQANKWLINHLGFGTNEYNRLIRELFEL